MPGAHVTHHPSTIPASVPAEYASDVPTKINKIPATLAPPRSLFGATIRVTKVSSENTTNGNASSASTSSHPVAMGSHIMCPLIALTRPAIANITAAKPAATHPHHLATSTERTLHKAKAATSVVASPINKNGKFSSNMHFILS